MAACTRLVTRQRRTHDTRVALRNHSEAEAQFRDLTRELDLRGHGTVVHDDRGEHPRNVAFMLFANEGADEPLRIDVYFHPPSDTIGRFVLGTPPEVRVCARFRFGQGLEPIFPSAREVDDTSRSARDVCTPALQTPFGTGVRDYDVGPCQ